MIKEYIIPKVTVEGVVSSAINSGVQIAVLNSKRISADQSNPYIGNSAMINSPDTPIGTSVLGTAVWDEVTFGDKNNPMTYTDSIGNIITLPVITFQAILIDVTFPRNIVKTEIQGRNGTVKEYIGEGDAQISFRGVITGNNGHYPIDEVTALKKVIKAPVSIPIICSYLNNLDIDTIVFEDRTLGQEEGSYSYQAFTLNAISDTPIELTISGL